MEQSGDSTLNCATVANMDGVEEEGVTHVKTSDLQESVSVSTVSFLTTSNPPNVHKRYLKGNISASQVGALVGIYKEDEAFRLVKDKVQRGRMQVKANFDVLKDYTVKEFEGNYYTRRGQFYEWVPLRVLEIIMQVLMMPGKTYPSPKYDWLYATPDGEFGDGRTKYIVEVKNPNSALHARIPDNYMAQMQTQMHCAGVTGCYFVSCCIKKSRCYVYKVPFSEEYWNWLIFQLEYLHEEALRGTATEDLDLDMFNFEPPEVKYERVYDVKNINLILKGDIEEFPEKNPLADRPKQTKRKRDKEEEEPTKKQKKDLGFDFSSCSVIH